MNSITSSATSSATQPLPAPPASSSSDDASSGQGGDLLAAMNPAMDAAFAVGRPMDKQGAAAILATTGAYIAGANATIDKLDEGIQRREKELAQLRISDPEAASGKEASLELLKKLRDRIQLSIERVSRTAAGDDAGDDDPASDEDLAVQKSTARTIEERDRLRLEQEELLEQRRLLLAPTSITTHTNSSTVAGTYAATAARTG